MRFVLPLLLLAAGCGSSTTSDRQSDVATPAADSTPPPAREAGSKPPPGGLANPFAALGLSVGLPVPEGLEPGGECPAAGAGAAEEIAAQAEAPIPLKAGLTLAYTWRLTPQQEYECLLHVQSVDADGVNTSKSCDSPQGKGPFLRRICRADLRRARMLHTMYGAVKVFDASGRELPETIVGATAFSLSSAELASLKRTGSMTHRYVELGPNGQVSEEAVGELRVEGRRRMHVIVNDRPIDLPVITVRGQAKWWVRGQRLDASQTLEVLDDERFPLLIDNYSSSARNTSRISFLKISYPDGGSGALEGRLRAGEQVDVYGIYFDFNSDRIRVESEPVLQEIGDLMQRNPGWRLSIAGHTDNVGGNSASNLALSRRRSEAVRTALVSRFGVSADRLSTGGYGAGLPKDTNDTPEGRARNRRVELKRN